MSSRAKHDTQPHESVCPKPTTLSLCQPTSPSPDLCLQTFTEGKVVSPSAAGVATRSKAIDKKKKKKKKQQQLLLKNPNDDAIASVDLEGDDAIAAAEAAGAEEESCSIDADKCMNYDELFPVEAKKFNYDPKVIKQKSVEAILDDHVKKKADRYCK